MAWRHSGTILWSDGVWRKWRTAYATVMLTNLVDMIFPNRDRQTDGTIASTEHSKQNPYSDHEARLYLPVITPVVLAVDITAKGAMAQEIISWLMYDPRVRYIIHDGEMIRSYQKGLIPPWARGASYTGTNPHRDHIHVSWVRDPELFDDTGPFGEIGDDDLRFENGDKNRMVLLLQVTFNRWKKDRSVDVEDLSQDSVWGEKTSTAMTLVERDLGLAETGQPNAAVLFELGATRAYPSHPDVDGEDTSVTLAQVNQIIDGAIDALDEESILRIGESVTLTVDPDEGDD